MSQKFKIGDDVLVVVGEGLDTPPEAQGKTGRITAYIKDDAGKVVEYWVTMPGVQSFNAAPYHILPIPKVRNPFSPRSIMPIVREKDPDLHLRIRQISESHYRLRDFSDATTVFVLLWLGVRALNKNPRMLEGSGIHEML